MRSKPIIDILPIVHDIQAVDALNSVMGRLGYEALGENGITGRRYFRKGGDVARSHHVHAYELDNPEVARHLDFRDYLRTHPEEACAYASLKQMLARKHPHDIEAYTEGKSSFVSGTIAKAQSWRLWQEED
jgi:GrpB-like predicted nucleotidyltransferase (UPF0157 family)